MVSIFLLKLLYSVRIYSAFLVSFFLYCNRTDTTMLEYFSRAACVVCVFVWKKSRFYRYTCVEFIYIFIIQCNSQELTIHITYRTYIVIFIMSSKRRYRRHYTTNSGGFLDFFVKKEFYLCKS